MLGLELRRPLCPRCWLERLLAGHAGAWTRPMVIEQGDRVAMRPHNPDLCDYLMLDATPDDKRDAAILRSTLLVRVPADPVPDAVDDFEAADTVVSMRTSMGYAASGRPPARSPDDAVVIDVCDRCGAPLVTDRTSPMVMAMLPVRCDGRCG